MITHSPLGATETEFLHFSTFVVRADTFKIRTFSYTCEEEWLDLRRINFTLELALQQFCFRDGGVLQNSLDTALCYLSNCLNRQATQARTMQQVPGNVSTKLLGEPAAAVYSDATRSCEQIVTVVVIVLVSNHEKSNIKVLKTIVLVFRLTKCSFWVIKWKSALSWFCRDLISYKTPRNFDLLKLCVLVYRISDVEKKSFWCRQPWSRHAQHMITKNWMRLLTNWTNWSLTGMFCGSTHLCKSTQIRFIIN